jgi:hypothetical protein
MYLPVLGCGSLATGRKSIKMLPHHPSVAHSGKKELTPTTSKPEVGFSMPKIKEGKQTYAY